MIVCVCNALSEKDCAAAAADPCCRTAGCVYRQFGVRVRCGRCVETMRRIVHHARERDAAARSVEDELEYGLTE